jgi:hypothetical protein
MLSGGGLQKRQLKTLQEKVFQVATRMANVEIQQTSKMVSSSEKDAPNASTDQDIVLEYDIPADGNYDGFGEPLREALEDRLAKTNKTAHIKVSVTFR